MAFPLANPFREAALAADFITACKFLNRGPGGLKLDFFECSASSVAKYGEKGAAEAWGVVEILVSLAMLAESEISPNISKVQTLIFVILALH